MKGSGLNLCASWRLPQALRHLLRRTAAKGQRQYLPGINLPALQQPGAARQQDAGLTAAGAGQHQHILFAVDHRQRLAVIERRRHDIGKKSARSLSTR